MSGLYQILINGAHRQTCYARNDQDAMEIAMRWFNNEPPTTSIGITTFQLDENGSHLQTYIQE